MKKRDIITGKAILARGFWTQNARYNGSPLPAESQTKWIVFQGRGEPFMGDYVNFYDGDMASMLSEESRSNLANYGKDSANYKRALLRGLCLMEEIDNDDDIALWTSDYTRSINDNVPAALHCVGDDYHDNSLALYRLSRGKGSFCEGESEYDSHDHTVVFAIVELLETRATKIDSDGSYVLVRKPVGDRVTVKKGSIRS